MLLRPLERGVYIVNWRVVSAVDGHPTSGSYAFGIGVVPIHRGDQFADDSRPHAAEIGARWLLLTGLVVLTGASVAAVARFGGVHDLALATAGWLATMIGLGLFTVAQLQSAGVTCRH